MASILRQIFGFDLSPAEAPPHELASAFKRSMQALADTSSSSQSSRSDAADGSTPSAAPQQHLQFVEGTYSEALRQAAAQSKPMLMFLYSDLHQDATDFCKHVLLSRDVVTFLNSNFIVWGASIHASDGYYAASNFDAAGFPYLGVYTVAPGSTPSRPSYQRWAVFQGASALFTSPQELVAQLRAVLNRCDELLGAERAERVARESEVRMREDMEREYRESEERDLRRAAEREAAERATAAAETQRRTEEAARKEREEEERELAEAVELSKTLHRESALQTASRRLALCPEPDSSVAAAEVTLIRFNLPNGTKVQRRFKQSDTMQTVRDYVMVTSNELNCGFEDPKDFQLASSFPRKVFKYSTTETETTLKETGLVPQAVLFVSSA